METEGGVSKDAARLRVLAGRAVRGRGRYGGAVPRDPFWEDNAGEGHGAGYSCSLIERSVSGKPCSW